MGKEEIKQTYKVSISLQILGKIVGEKMVLGLKASRKKISISDKASPEMKEYFWRTLIEKNYLGIFERQNRFSLKKVIPIALCTST